MRCYSRQLLSLWIDRHSQAGNGRSAKLVSYAPCSLTCCRLWQYKLHPAQARTHACTVRHSKQHSVSVSFRKAEGIGSAQPSIRSPGLYLLLQNVLSKFESAELYQTGAMPHMAVAFQSCTRCPSIHFHASQDHRPRVAD